MDGFRYQGWKIGKSPSVLMAALSVSVDTYVQTPISSIYKVEEERIVLHPQSSRIFLRDRLIKLHA